MKKELFDDYDLLDTNKLREFLGISRDKAYALMHNKSFPSRKIGKTYYVTFIGLKKWLNNV